MPVAVFRRYTPPTCTLELQGERSSLSVWSRRPVIRQVRFALKIDGPHRHPDQRIILQGNRSDLDALHQAVSTYVQQTLKLSAGNFQTLMLSPARVGDNGDSPPPESPDRSTSEPDARAAGAPLAFAGAASPHRRNSSPLARRLTGPVAKPLRLLPQGLLKHELELGALRADPPIRAVTLTTTELFDLVNALDSYQADVDVIPELMANQRPVAPAPWLKVAAIALLAIGTTATLIRLQSSTLSPSFETASQSSGPNSSQRDRAADDVESFSLDPIPPATDALPGSRGSGADDSLTDGRGRGDRDADNRSPEADSAFEDLSDDPLALEQPGGNAPTPTDPNTAATDAAPPTGESALIPATPGATPPVAFGRPATAPGSAPSPSAPPPAPANGVPTDPTDIPPELTAIPPIQADGMDNILLDSSEINLSAPPTLEANPPRAQASADSASGAFPAQTRSRTAPVLSPQTQIAEVEAYFNARWQPPANLRQALQYRLLFNPDGRLRQAIPLGESARSSQSVANIPEPGTPVVSPFSGNDTPPLRVFLGADGQVRVFLESLE